MVKEGSVVRVVVPQTQYTICSTLTIPSPDMYSYNNIYPLEMEIIEETVLSTAIPFSGQPGDVKGSHVETLPLSAEEEIVAQVAKELANDIDTFTKNA